jgi:hypothetical protein
VLPSNAQAARFAALLIDPRLEGTLLAGAPPHAGGIDRHPPAPAPSPPASAVIPPPRVINFGLEVFADELGAQAVPVVHVDWPPPPGDARFAALLAALDDDVELEPGGRPGA